MKSSEPIDLHLIQGSEASDKEIERIVIFFNDGTFKSFQQK